MAHWHPESLCVDLSSLFGHAVRIGFSMSDWPWPGRGEVAAGLPPGVFHGQCLETGTASLRPKAQYLSVFQKGEVSKPWRRVAFTSRDLVS